MNDGSGCLFGRLYDIVNTAISKNVVKRKAKSHKPRLQGNMGNFETMLAPYSKDLQWCVIWMKEVLGYEVDEVEVIGRPLNSVSMHSHVEFLIMEAECSNILRKRFRNSP